MTGGEGLMGSTDKQDEEEAREERLLLLQESYGKKRSQLNIILDIIGTPKDSDMSHIDAETADFIRGLESRPPKYLASMFPGTNPLGIELLQAMLHFDPKKRITAQHAMEHPYFNSLKNKSYSKAYFAKNRHIFDPSIAVSTDPVPLNVDIEKISESSANLKENVLSEVLYYRKRDPPL